MRKIKFLHTTEEGIFYPVMWEFGYIRFFNQYQQFFTWRQMNWVEFSLVNVAFEYSKTLGSSFTLTIIILGFGLMIFHNDISEEASTEIGAWISELMLNQKERSKIIEELAVSASAPAELRERAAASIALDRKQTSEHEKIFDI